MAHYRLYLLNSLGRIIRPEAVEAGTDDAAIAAAREFDHAFGVEIWDGARRVATVRPGSTTGV